MKTVNTRVLSLFLFFVMLMGVVSASSLFAFAAGGASQSAIDSLTTAISGSVIGDSFKVSGGGSVGGDKVFVASSSSGGGGTIGYSIDSTVFSSLSGTEQSRFISTIVAEAYSKAADPNTTTFDLETVEAWTKEIQSIPGVGSKLLATILAQTKPDFVTANRIYTPFAGPIGIVLGLLSIIIMALLGIVMALDIAYIVIPPFRMFVADSDSGTQGSGSSGQGSGGIVKSKMFSYDAIYAVQVAENQDGNASGAKKQALAIYLKNRVFALIILGICLLYLIQGQIYSLVGAVLDLVSGFLS